ncbi:MAG TPA: hypothetical protein VGA61_04860 [Anaerolineae bacterium]
MKIQVKLGEPIWRTVGRHRLALDWPDDVEVTVAEVLGRLAASYPGFGRAYAGAGLVQAFPYRVFVDAEQVLAPRLPPLAALGPSSTLDAAPSSPALRDGQTVYFLLPTAGG